MSATALSWLSLALLTLLAHAQSNFRVCVGQRESSPAQYNVCINTVIFTLDALVQDSGNFDAACENLDWGQVIYADLDGPFASIELCGRYGGRGTFWYPDDISYAVAQLALARDAIHLAQLDPQDPALSLICANTDVSILNSAQLPGSRIWSAGCNGVYPNTYYNGTGAPSTTYTPPSSYTGSSRTSSRTPGTLSSRYNASSIITIAPTTASRYSASTASTTSSCTSSLVGRADRRAVIRARAPPSGANTTAIYDYWLKEVLTAMFAVDQVRNNRAGVLCDDTTIPALDVLGYDGQYGAALL